MRDTLIDLFDYDLWANLRWFRCIAGQSDSKRLNEIMVHIVGAQRNWLTRCLSVEETVVASGDLEADLKNLHAQWVDLLRICDLNAYASYSSLSGDNYFTMVGEIAQHVINHGTYHRGHLRGLMEARGVTDFPETDLIRWHRGQRED